MVFNLQNRSICFLIKFIVYHLKKSFLEFVSENFLIVGFIKLSFMKYMKKFILFLLVFFFSASSVQAGFETSPEWLAVAHYRPQGKSYESTVDSPNFFNAPNGKTSPRDELAATINLFENATENEKKCLFPARYKLLKKHGLVKAKYPQCKDLEQFYKDLQPSGVTLLFTDAYMNNPSSLFGHTLLRIDTARKGTQLLAHGANYGAFTDGKENSVLFAVWGLTGGYYGGFTVKPYYDVINTYNNIENRDIWEFNLNFTPEELDYFVAHLWEIGNSQSRYYFFTRNCSYMLMETLDAVRPSLKLADEFPVQTIPLDTLKSVMKKHNLVKNVYYRPSRQAKIRHRYRQMKTEQKSLYLKAIVKQDYTLSGLNNSEKADVLETAYQYVQYQYVAHQLELDDYRKRSFKLLMARNKITESGTISDVQEGNSPLQTHDSMRATIGSGFRNGEAFQEISYRPAYHSLSDDNHGFLRGAEINFLNTVVRHYDHSNKTVLQRFDLVGIKSVSPIDTMFKPISYVIEADIAREFNPQTEKEGYAFNLKVGGGSSFALNDEIWIYALGNSYVSYGGFLPHNGWAGVGAAVGVFADFDKWRLLAESEKVWATSRFGDRIKYKVEAAYTLNRNNAVALEYHFQENHGKNLEEGLLGWRTYF